MAVGSKKMVPVIPACLDGSFLARPYGHGACSRWRRWSQLRFASGTSILSRRSTVSKGRCAKLLLPMRPVGAQPGRSRCLSQYGIADDGLIGYRHPQDNALLGPQVAVPVALGWGEIFDEFDISRVQRDLFSA